MEMNLSCGGDGLRRSMRALHKSFGMGDSGMKSFEDSIEPLFAVRTLFSLIA